MPRLRPNQHGVLVPIKPIIQTNSTVQAFKQPNTALRRLDRVLSTGKPKILVSRTQGGIGDVLMTTPVVRSVSKKYDTKVDYATDFDYLNNALPKVLQGNPYIDNIISFRDVVQKDYDAVIELTCPCVYHEKPLAPPVNRIDLFAKHADVQLDSPALDYFHTEEERKWAESYLSDYNLKGKYSDHALILVQGVSSSKHRDPPPEKIQRALARIAHERPDVRILPIVHQTDHSKHNWKFSNVHVLNNMSVRHIAAIMQFCDLVLCPDSAILHLASAMRKKTVTVFGPTDPRARVNYHPEAVAVWPGKELKNYPSWYNDPGDGYLCWKRLDPDDIASTCLSLLENRPLPVCRDIVHFGKYSQTQNYFFERV